MDFSGIMQYISYLLVAIGVMAFVVSTITQVVKSWPGLDKLPTSAVVIVLSLVLCPVTFVALMAWMDREISQACEQAIYAGVDVTLSDGTVEHYSLTPHDQLNLLDRRARLTDGAIKLEYHADGQPCRFYDVQDMRLIITAASEHIGHHTAYCNSLNMWLAGCQTADEVALIYYGASTPDRYRSEILQTYLADGGDTNG